MNIHEDLAIVVPYYARPEFHPKTTVDNIYRGGFKMQQLSISYDCANKNGLCDAIPAYAGSRRTQHQFNLGPALHFHWCWRWILQTTDKPWLMLVENDVRFNPQAAKALEEQINRTCDLDEGGIYSLFTPQIYAPYLPTPDQHGWVDYRPGYNSSAGQCMCIHRQHLAHMMFDFTIPMMDFGIGKWTAARGIPNYYAIPSLAEHISEFSTVKNERWTEHKGIGYKDD